jgi:hypothetical protein
MYVFSKGLGWMVHQESTDNCGGILADEMGKHLSYMMMITMVMMIIIVYTSEYVFIYLLSI